MSDGRSAEKRIHCRSLRNLRESNQGKSQGNSSETTPWRLSCPKVSGLLLSGQLTSFSPVEAVPPTVLLQASVPSSGGGGVDHHFGCFLQLLSGLERQRADEEPMQPGVTMIYLKKYLEGGMFYTQMVFFFFFCRHFFQM